jgi:G3E family GTPase
MEGPAPQIVWGRVQATRPPARATAPHARARARLALPQARRRLRAVLAHLNPRAALLEATRCAVDLRYILNTGRFDPEKARPHGGPGGGRWDGFAGRGARGSKQAPRAAAPGKGAVGRVLNAHPFPPPHPPRQAAEAPGWMAALQAGAGGGARVPEAEEYGVASFVYRARRPFHPGRLYHTFLKVRFWGVEARAHKGGIRTQVESRGGSEGEAWGR